MPSKAGITLEDTSESKRVNASSTHKLHTDNVDPEKIETRDAQEIDEVRRWSDHIRSELVGIAETKLKLMDYHECQQHESCESEVQGSQTLFLDRCQFHVPSLLKPDEDMR